VHGDVYFEQVDAGLTRVGRSEEYHMPVTVDGVRWMTQQEIATTTGFSITKVRNVVQVLESVDQIVTRIDPQDGKSKLVRDSDLELIRKALNRGA
jgi:hypothetical protein